MRLFDKFKNSSGMQKARLLSVYLLAMALIAIASSSAGVFAGNPKIPGSLTISVVDSDAIPLSGAAVSVAFDGEQEFKPSEINKSTFIFEMVGSRAMVNVDHPSYGYHVFEFSLPQAKQVNVQVILAKADIKALVLNSENSDRELIIGRAVSKNLIQSLPDGGILAGGFADDCAIAQAIAGEGLFFFDTTNATTDGIPNPVCEAFGTDVIENDVWFCWTAATSSQVTVSTCGQTTMDSRLAVYDGCSCPEGSGILDCNDDTCGLQSEVVFSAVGGQQYLIRLGNFPGAAPGVGTFEITLSFASGACCLPDDSCAFVTEADCAALGGSYLGDNVSCGAGNPVNMASFPHLNIPDDTPAGVSDIISGFNSFTVGDVNIGLTITHTWVGDLCVTLEHNGVSVDVIQRMGDEVAGDPCHEEGPFGCLLNNLAGIVLDDSGLGGNIEDACLDNLTSPPNYVPNNSLSAFNGMDASGDWTLTVVDRAGLDTGTFDQWSLELDTNVCKPGNPCPADLDGSGTVNTTDLLILFANWGPNPGSPADLDGNGTVNTTDLLILFANWGSCP